MKQESYRSFLASRLVQWSKLAMQDENWNRFFDAQKLFMIKLIEMESPEITKVESKTKKIYE